MKLFRLTSLLLLLGLVGPLYAQESDVVVDIDRDGMALRAELDVRPDDRDTTDTAIIASNTSGRPARVICTAFDANGNRLGTAGMRVPGKGLRYLRASDLANGVDYVGQVRCRSGNASIQGSALLVGAGGITDLPVVQHSVNGSKHIVATVTASF